MTLQLMNNSLRHRSSKATLAAQLEQVRQENARLRAAVQQARLYAGDNLPAGTGLTLAIMLEKALAGEEGHV